MTANLETRAAAGEESSTALYLYCLARKGALESLDGPTLEEGTSPTVVPFGDVFAVVSVVPRDEFSGPGAESRMQDLAWIGPRICRHEEVVERVMRSSPVVPARFATLFSSRARLEAWLATHHAAVAGALERFTDHGEWAVKGMLNRTLAEARLFAIALGREGNMLPSSPGARYLAEQRIRAGVGQELNAWLQGARERVADELRTHAVEFRERAIVSAASPGEEAPVLNWAFLVPRKTLADFTARIHHINASYSDQGLVLSLSGPWPPYSFCPSFEGNLLE